MDKILKLIFPPFAGCRASTGLLLARLFFGLGIALHGFGKFGRVEGFAEGVGVPVFLAWGAVLTEFVGGIFIMIGALTPLVSLALVGNMAVAALHHIRKGDGFLLSPGPNGYSAGWEFAALYLFGFAVFLLAGPGRFAVDYLLFKNRLEE